MGQLHDRNCRRAFAPPEAFQAQALPAERFQAEIQAGTAAGRQLSEASGGRGWGLLSYAPYLVPFRERAKLFQAVVAQVRSVRRRASNSGVPDRGTCYALQCAGRNLPEQAASTPPR